jgi:uncharacterized SAM-binding protein YcdF (DUF218 family)
LKTHSKRKWLFRLSGALAIAIVLLGCWVQWGVWPDPAQAPIFVNADAIVILGGGDSARWQHGEELAKTRPGLPLIVTGDDGLIVNYLVSKVIPSGRILHENAATTTVENAKFTKPMLDRLGTKRVVLVTNWFHAPRSLAIFHKYQPGREFVVSFSPKPVPLNRWDLQMERRERMAAIYNLLRHGVWSW